MSWQERIRKAFNARDAQARQRIEEQRQREEVNGRAQKEEETRRARELREAIDILRKVEARKLLERVKEDVWRKGSIIEGPGTLIALDWTRGGKRENKEYVSDGGVYVSPGEPFTKGLWRDRLSISVMGNKDRRYLEVRDVRDFGVNYNVWPFSDYHWETEMVARSLNDPNTKLIFINNSLQQARNELEEAVLKFCENRIRLEHFR